MEQRQARKEMSWGKNAANNQKWPMNIGIEQRQQHQ